MCNGGQFVGADGSVFTAQGNTHDGHIINAHRFNDRLHDAEVGWKPIFVAVHLVVEIQDRFFARNSDFKCDGQYGLPRLTD